jgi:hypothetical protein
LWARSQANNPFFETTTFSPLPDALPISLREGVGFAERRHIDPMVGGWR